MTYTGDVFRRSPHQQEKVRAGRRRHGGATERGILGYTKLDALEAKLAQGPAVSVPTIAIGGDFDGPNTDGKAYRPKFSGKFEHRVLNGIGHNLHRRPRRNSPRPVLDVDRF